MIHCEAAASMCACFCLPFFFFLSKQRVINHATCADVQDVNELTFSSNDAGLSAYFPIEFAQRTWILGKRVW